jgi:hypothetical protein
MRHLDLHFGSLLRSDAVARPVPPTAKPEGRRLGSVAAVAGFAVPMALLLAGILLRFWLYLPATAQLPH